MFQKITEETFGKVYPFLEEAFPVIELREKEKQKELLAKKEYRLYGIENEENQLQGAIAFWEIEDFAYVEHFAVAKEFRNGGFGGEKLEEFVEFLNKPTVLEVELPKDELAARRIGFYERHGFVLNGYSYVQPPLRDGQPLLPLRLMTTPKKIGRKDFERYKRQIYRTVYDFQEA